MSKEDKFIIAFVIVSISLCVSLWFNFKQNNASTASETLNEYLIKEFHKKNAERLIKIKNDSIRIEVEFAKSQEREKERYNNMKNEYTKLQSKLSKINSFVDSDDFNSYNDSIKMCCTGHN